MNLLPTLKRIRACEGEVAAQLVLEAYVAERVKEELAASQARVKELEDVLIYVDDSYCFTNDKRVNKALSTTPDQALQRALLDVLIAEYEAEGGDPIRERYLRAKRAELGE